MDKVAADIHQSPAAELHMGAIILRVDAGVAEVANDGANFANAMFVEQFAHSDPLRMAVDHESLADLDPGPCANGE